MTTPKLVNKALAALGSEHVIRRNLLGGSYYYFTSETASWEVPSIYAYSLGHYTTGDVVRYYLEALVKHGPSYDAHVFAWECMNVAAKTLDVYGDARLGVPTFRVR